MRLDKFLSQSTELSRKDAKKLIHTNVITVNDKPIRDSGYHVDVANDEVRWAGDLLSVATGHRYLLLYKPDGFECTLKSKEHPIVTELIALPQVDQLRIAGRLDVDTTGALLLSDDGQWLHRVTSPKHACNKVYEVTLAEPMSLEQQNAAIKKVAKGIQLQEERDKTKPALLEFTASDSARLTLTEGKYHQVKRMFAALGNHVAELHRSQIGRLTLEGLEMGESRFLTQAEVESF